MAGRFSNKLVLVAGGTGGLGRAVSLAFLQEGANVAVTFRVQEEFDALKESAGREASLLTGHNVDVTDDAAVKKMVETHSRQSATDGCACEHGRGVQGRMKFWEQDSKVLDQMLSLNLRSSWALARAVRARNLETRRGSDCQCCGQSGVRCAPRCRGLRCFESGRNRDDELSGR